MADNSNYAVINLGSQRVSGAIFSKNRSGELTLKQFEFAEMHGDPSTEATRLPQLRIAMLELSDKLKLKGKDAWYSIAGHVVFTRFVKLPPFADDKADQIVEFEARQNVPFPINEVIWDYEFIGDSHGGEREVALVAIKADALNDINDQVESSGVNVAGVDLAPLAVFNAFKYNYPEVEESSLIIDLGARSTNLVFIEGDRVFTRNILIGGSSVTSAISKEFGANFVEAEDRKRSKGFVAPGGAYEPHEDEEVDAISKIMRNTMTRLHGEVVRTINYYRSQQGGSTPQRIFLCGGGAHTALVSEFFEEKFNLPVEVLNPLRGVQLDRRLDANVAASNAASIAELVGLALRQAGSCPVEVELIPDSVEKSRDAARRAPFLIMAMLSLFAVLGVAALYFKRAEGVVQKQLVQLNQKKAQLEKDTAAIRQHDKTLEMLKSQSSQLEQAVQDRGYWNRILMTLNNKFENDLIWLTQIEVLKDGVPLTKSNTAAQVAAPIKPKTPIKGAPVVVAASPYSLRIQGLYRKNDNGQAVVYKYYDDLKALTDIFGATDQKADANSGLEDDRYAYQFKFSLPLATGMKFEK